MLQFDWVGSFNSHDPEYSPEWSPLKTLFWARSATPIDCWIFCPDLPLEGADDVDESHGYPV